MIGTTLGPYEITAKLGEGGMGEVWRATDTKLDREVAIKVLPAAFTEDSERLARFEREAKLLAQLHHPNIASIFGLEESEGTRALVMELVEGPTLAERLERDSIPLSDVLSIAKQIAEALEEAHEKGIVHRDLKPQNIKASIEGKVKVLDFGLAKAMDPMGTASGAPSASQLAASPTLTLGATVQGVILGTAAYMAPEQAKGFAVDKRADIWAFGVVLWEMLTGRSLFAGDSVPDTLARVLQREVDFDALPAGTPPAIRRLLRRCLERNPKNRLHDIADARIVIDEALSGGEPEGADAARTASGRWPLPLVALGGALLLVVGLGLGWGLGRGAGPSQAEVPAHLSLVFPEDLEVAYAKWSPDGTAALLSARRRDDPQRTLALYRRELDGEEATRFRGTDRLSSFLLSPDGRTVVFVAASSGDAGDRRLLRMPADGSQPPVEIARWDPSWNDHVVLADGSVVVVVSGGKLLRVGGGEGASAEAAEIDVGRPGLFFFGESEPLPDGRIFVDGEAWSASGYEGFTALVDPGTGKGSIVIPDGGRAQFVAPDRVLFARGSTLLAARFDPAAGRIVGQPVALVEGMRIGEAWETGQFRLARDGSLAFAPGGQVGAERTFAILDPASGAVEPWGTEARAFRLEQPQPAPDGRSVYGELANAVGTYETWRVPRSGPAQPVIALADADSAGAVISPDGTTLAFARVARQPSDGIYLVPVDRSAPPRELLRVPSADVAFWPLEWTPDGRRLLYVRGEAGVTSIGEMAVDGAAEPRVVVEPAWSATLSPDGRRLAFVSEISGRAEVYVADYSPGASLGERSAASREGGGDPVWSPDSRRLYFRDRGTQLLAIDIGADGRPSGEPRTVADREELRIEGFNTLPDGRLIVLRRGPREQAIDRFDVILHFDRLLAERLP